MSRLFLRLDRTFYPQIKDRYPLIYLERGRLEVDDSSVKFLSAEYEVMLPVAEIAVLFLGPGTSVTHESVKVLSSCGCGLCFVGEDCLHFYCQGISPTTDTRQMLRQCTLALNPVTRLDIARRMFAYRFNNIELSQYTLQELMGIEGCRVREFYRNKALEYGCKWQGRSYVPGAAEKSDPINKRLTFYNVCLYGICTSTIVAMGLSPHVGFIHQGSPLPLTYDLADLYKGEICVDLAFSRHAEKGFNRRDEVNAFVQRCCDCDLLKRMSEDLRNILQG